MEIKDLPEPQRGKVDQAHRQNGYVQFITIEGKYRVLLDGDFVPEGLRALAEAVDYLNQQKQ